MSHNVIRTKKYNLLIAFPCLSPPQDPELNAPPEHPRRTAPLSAAVVPLWPNRGRTNWPVMWPHRAASGRRGPYQLPPSDTPLHRGCGGRWPQGWGQWVCRGGSPDGRPLVDRRYRRRRGRPIAALLWRRRRRCCVLLLEWSWSSRRESLGRSRRVAGRAAPRCTLHSSPWGRGRWVRGRRHWAALATSNFRRAASRRVAAAAAEGGSSWGPRRRCWSRYGRRRGRAASFGGPRRRYSRRLSSEGLRGGLSCRRSWKSKNCHLLPLRPLFPGSFLTWKIKERWLNDGYDMY